MEIHALLAAMGIDRDSDETSKYTTGQHIIHTQKTVAPL